MIKQIQLRGISRTPSDRMTQDGGCAESLNVHLADSELSPTLPPEDVTGDLGLPENAGRDYIYIHKGNGYVNYITLDDLEIGAYVQNRQTQEYQYEVIAYMEQGETLQSVSGIGNTIVIMGDRHPYYALFKDGHYIFLGNTIPLPEIRIWPEPVEHESWGGGEIEEWTGYDNFLLEGGDATDPANFLPGDKFYDKDSWNEKAREAEDSGQRFAGIEGIEDAEPGEEEDWDIMTGMKAYIEQAYQKAKENRVLVNQVMMMYGVRLYTGGYITSVPYLMPGGFESPFFCRYLRQTTPYPGGSSVVRNMEICQYGARYPYRIKAQILDFDEETMRLWSDIIQSVDFFMTPVIPFDISEEKVAYVTQEYEPSVIDGGVMYNYFELQPYSSKYAKGYINRVLVNRSDMFRRVEALSTDGMSYEAMERIAQFRDGALLDLGDYIADQDLLLTQPALAEFKYDMRNAERTGKTVTSMNNRLLLTGVTETIPSGSSVFPAAPCYLKAADVVNHVPAIEQSHKVEMVPVPAELAYIVDDSGPMCMRAKSDFNYPQNYKYVQIVYHIQGRESYTVRGRIGGNGTVIDRTDGTMDYFGFLVFPDPRCKSVDIYLSYDMEVWYRKTYEMREWAGLNCSYMYIGVDKNILWDIGHVSMTYDRAVAVYSQDTDAAQRGDVSNITENRIEQKDNVLLLSDVDNPWFFPLENEYTMQATRIIGTALATKALSTGQFGQFPLYVFTDNGIFAMQMNSEGTFSSSHAVSMDVAKEGTILSLDQAVAFVTDKGLLLLTGSDTQNLSQYMNGVHYVIEDDARAVFGSSPWSPLISPLQDSTHFMKFMETARLAYDYTGDRIICFNAGKDYMYVYMLRTATWHKMSLPEGTEFSRLLNSYPDTYLSARVQDVGSSVANLRILNFSTPLDVSSSKSQKAVIVTRPFDLGEPDVRKTIKSIRIRGQYNRNDVKYILLGSMDGLNWGILPSLRGGSYKLFRMIILADLAPTERISWIDIDYESRFANKLR